MPWYLYLIQNKAGNRIYTGVSTDPEKRLKAHNAGKGAKATRAGRPWKLFYTKECGTKGDALREEARIKKLSRAEKLRLHCPDKKGR